MLKKAVEDAINEQVKGELESAYLYLSMSAYCESINLPGFAHWMRLQSQEEVSHAMKLFNFLCDRGGRVVLQAVDQPPVDFESPQKMMQEAFDHERSVTGMINNLYELAVKEKDYATQSHLQWFVMEQVEEEKSASEIVDRLKLVGDQPAGLLILDRELGSRTLGG